MYKKNVTLMCTVAFAAFLAMQPAAASSKKNPPELTGKTKTESEKPELKKETQTSKESAQNSSESVSSGNVQNASTEGTEAPELEQEKAEKQPPKVNDAESLDKSPESADEKQAATQKEEAAALDDAVCEEQPAASSPETYAEEREEQLSVDQDGKTDTQTDENESAHSSIPTEKVYVPIVAEGIDHEMTEKFRRQFSSGNGRRLLVESLKNSERVRPYVIQKLKENGLPLYLQYLPIVESNYIPSAVSRSGATGIWQFMENSMAPLLRKDAWYDERRDSWKSTDAAIAKLMDNYRFFEDWSLAIAAYNCGAGAMQKLLRQNPGKTYWDLVDQELINKQTGQYVPKLLAIADLVENAAWYGLSDVEEANLLSSQKEVEEFDYVTTTGMLSFNQIAEITGIDKSEVKELNLALFRNCTPARETYQLRLPKGYGEDAAEKFKTAGVAKDAVIYTVKSGDTLWGISRKYGITVEDICLVNGINEKSVLSIGKRLIVPIFK